MVVGICYLDTFMGTYVTWNCLRDSWDNDLALPLQCSSAMQDKDDDNDGEVKDEQQGRNQYHYSSQEKQLEQPKNEKRFMFGIQVVS